MVPNVAADKPVRSRRRGAEARVGGGGSGGRAASRTPVAASAGLVVIASSSVAVLMMMLPMLILLLMPSSLHAFQTPCVPTQGGSSPSTTTLRSTTRRPFLFGAASAKRGDRLRGAPLQLTPAEAGFGASWDPSRASPWARRPSTLTQLFASRSSSSEGKGGVESPPDTADAPPAQDLEALQALFAKYCDKQGLMTMADVRKVPAIAELLKGGDLLEEEFSDIWNRAPKFPDLPTATAASQKNAKKGRQQAKRPKPRIDVDSFVQLYRDIDDLFEDDNDEDDAVGTQGGGKVDEKSPISAAKGAKDQRTATSSDVEASTAVGAVNGARPDAESGDVDDEDDVVEAELETIFESLCDKNKLVSKAVVREWDEVSKLLEDGLLGEDEFDELWKNTAKSPGSDDQLDVYGFLSFNVGLDGLFDFDDEEMDDDEVSDDTPAAAVDAAQPEPTPMVVVDGDGLSPSQLFRKLTDAARSTTLSREGLLRWRFLSEVLEDGDLKEEELDSIFQKSSSGKAVLDEAGFVALYRSIDDLFEENYEEEDEEDEEFDEDDEALELLKLDLLVTLENLSDPELLPCGLDCTEGEQKEVLDLVSELEGQPTNRIRSRGGDVDVAELNGSWDLLYSSSSAMRFNKGLSGLGGSFPNGKFGGLKQVLKSTKFVSDVQYVERIEVTPSAASFDVTVTGDWELRQSVSLFTGEPSLVMTVQPDRVTYGVTNMKADHWKSLGPMNMLDVTYLDDDLRIMRGNTAVDTVFIFRRSPQ